MTQSILEIPSLITPESPLEPQPNQGAEERLLGALIVLAKHKRMILKAVGLGMVGGLFLAVFLPSKYEATAKIMPPKQSQSVSTFMMGQLGPLAALAIPDIGLGNASDLYIAVLHSRTVADALVERFHLMQIYNENKIEDARKRLDEVSEITAGREGVISIVVHDSDPQRAAEMANAYVAELQKLTRTLTMTEAGRRRLFFKQEVQKAGVELTAAELAMKHVQETTGVIQLDSQSKAMIEGLMTMRAGVMAKQAQVQSMRTFATPENPDLVRAEQELKAMLTAYVGLERGKSGHSITDVPLEKMPEAGLAYLRGLREVKYRESLVEVLTKQYEIARIDEAKDGANIQVLDPAVRPGIEVRTWSFRLTIALLMACFWFLEGSALAYIMDAIAEASSNPEYSSRLQFLKFWLNRAHESGDMV